jgi:CrcB protein
MGVGPRIEDQQGRHGHTVVTVGRCLRVRAISRTRAGNVAAAMSDPDAPALRPPHQRPALLATVWLGGFLGTGSRYLLGQVVPHLGRVPIGTVMINVLGAFTLGVLLQRLGSAGPDVGRRRWLRLFLGTGFLGGFTTYSALALDSTMLLRAGLTGQAAAYALGTLLVGALASLAGIAVAGGLRR